MFKKFMTALIIMLMAAAGLLACGAPAGSSAGRAGENTAAETESLLDEGKTYEAVITVKDYGEIRFTLRQDKAPISAANFVKLAREGFYDGLTFHRIINGFMIQGGDPNGDGTGGSDHMIKGEFKSNGVDNDLAHVRGVVSMARAQDPNSASSQFFIMQQDAPHLNGDYAAFGEVTEGMEIVDKICEAAVVTDGNGSVARENQPVIEKIEIIEN